MNTLTKLALIAALLTTTLAAQAGTVRGYFRSNGTYVAPHYRTPANGTPSDNLSYRGYPSQQPGSVSPRNDSFDSSLSRPAPMPRYDSDRFNAGTRPLTGSSYTPNSQDCHLISSLCSMANKVGCLRVFSACPAHLIPVARRSLPAGG